MTAERAPIICDFCGTQTPLGRGAWRYPCADFEALIVGLTATNAVGMAEAARYVGPWLACPTCHGLIETGNMDGLARRSAFAQDPKVDPVLVDAVRQLHDAFTAHRTGPATPLPLA